MARKYERKTSKPLKKEIEQKSDTVVRGLALAMLIPVGLVNVYALTKGVQAPFEWWVPALLLGIAGGKEVLAAVAGRLGGGK